MSTPLVRALAAEVKALRFEASALRREVEELRAAVKYIPSEESATAEWWNVHRLVICRPENGLRETTYVALAVFENGDACYRLTPGCGRGWATKEEAESEGRDSGLKEWRRGC